MTATPPENGMGPEAPVATARSARRTRRLAIIGALALVLVAGAVLVGVTATGSRSGTLSTQATKVDTKMWCSRSYRMEFEEDYRFPNVWLVWTIPSGTTAGTAFSAYQRTGTSPNFTYSALLGSTALSSINFDVATHQTGQTYVITWGRATPTVEDTKYSEVWCSGY